MWAVEIHDLDDRGVLAFDLGEVLDVLDPRASTFNWIVSDYDPVAEDTGVQAFADTVSRARDEKPRGVRVTSSELRSLAQNTRQTIDGLFIAVTTKGESPLLVRAVDSSFWVVVTDSADDVDAIRQRFSDVRDADPSREWPPLY